MRRASMRLVGVTATALALLGVAPALPAGAKAAKPKVTITAFTPLDAPARGGRLAITGSVTGATSCTVTAYPKVVETTTNCAKLPVVKVPANKTQRPVSFKVKLTATGPGGSTSTTATLTQHAPIFIELWGDSMLYQSGPFIAAALQAANADIVATLHAWPATSICYWNNPALADGIPAMLGAHKPAAILLDFSGLFTTGCAPSNLTYAGKPFDANVATFTAQGYAQTTAAYKRLLIQLVAAKVGHITVVPLPTRDMDISKTSTTLLQEVSLRKAISDGVDQAASPKVTFLDASPSITKPDGSFSYTLPCLAQELSAAGHCTGPVVDGVATNYVRASDGLHLCNVTWKQKPPFPAPGCPGTTYSSGATRYSSYVASAMLSTLAAG